MPKTVELLTLKEPQLLLPTGFQNLQFIKLALDFRRVQVSLDGELAQLLPEGLVLTIGLRGKFLNPAFRLTGQRLDALKGPRLAPAGTHPQKSAVRAEVFGGIGQKSAVVGDEKFPVVALGVGGLVNAEVVVEEIRIPYQKCLDSFPFD